MIDHEQEELITLTGATSIVPKRNGRKVHVSTVYRWTTSGCRGVRLEYSQVGATRMTSREALARFFARLAGDLAPQQQRSSTTCLQQPSVGDIAAAERELDEDGIG